MLNEIKSYKTTSLLHAKYIEDSRKLTTTQKRTVLYIYAKIYERIQKSGEIDWYTIDIDDLFHELQAYKGGNQTVLIWDHLSQLVETKVEIEYDDEKEDGSIEKRVRVTGLISEIDRPIAAQGQFKVKISDIIEKNIQYEEGHIYRWILLRYAMKLSGHALDIYEMLKAVENIPKWYISIDDLKGRTHCQSKYAKFAHFEERVLVPAQKEITSETDLSFRYKVDRGKRKVVLGITFYITKKSRNKSKEILISNPEGSLMDRLEKKGVVSPDKFNIPAVIWEKALQEEPRSPPNHIVTTAKRLAKEQVQKSSGGNITQKNKDYWNEINHLYKTPTSINDHSVLYAGDVASETKEIFFSLSHEDFKKKLAPFIKDGN